MRIILKWILVPAVAFASPNAISQALPKAGGANVSATAEHFDGLAESGRCPEALPGLLKSVDHVTDKGLQKRLAIDGVRCASLVGEATGYGVYDGTESELLE